MIKLLTDPTVNPLAEVDLSKADARVSFLPGMTWQNKDIVNERPDGGSVVFSRKARSQIQLNLVAGISNEEWQKVQRLRQSGKPVEFAPNWDSRTRFYAPLSQSTKALFKDKSQNSMYYDSGIFVGGDTSRYVFNDETQTFDQVDANTPRRRPGNLGKGIYFTAGDNNLVINAGHSDAGTQLVYGVGGSPVIEWTVDENSPVTDKGGCTRISNPAGTSSADTVGIQASPPDGTSDINEVYVAELWIKGKGELSSIGLIDSGVIEQKTDIPLSGSWQRITFKGNGNGGSLIQLLITLRRKEYQSELFIGPVHVSRQNQGPYDTEATHYWDGSTVASTYSQEQIRYNNADAGFPPNEITLTALGMWPGDNVTGRLVDASTSDVYNLLGIYSGNELRFYYSSNTSGNLASQSVILPNPEQFRGKPFYAWARAKVGATADESLFEVGIKIDGKEYKTSTNLEVGYTVQVASDILIGGPSLQKSADILPQHIRIDERCWSDDEIELHKDIFTTNHWRSLLIQTLGKRYRIADYSIAPMYANWVTLQGSIVLQEIDDIDGMGIDV